MIINYLRSYVISMQFLQNAFPDIYNKCQFGEKNLWLTFLESPQCETDFPKHCQLTEFQKLLVVQALRPDRLLSTIEYSCLRISGI